jgi:hypothetical protein
MKRVELQESLNIVADWTLESGRNALAAANLSIPEQIKVIAIEIFAAQLETMPLAPECVEHIHRIREALLSLKERGFLTFE